MSQKTDAVVASTIGIDTGKNTLHLVGLDEQGTIVLREKPKALEAMAKTPNTNRQEAVEKLVTAGGGKLVAMYGTMVDGPGAIAIMDVERIVAPAIAAVVASSDGVHNVRAYRLYTMEEVIAIRQKRVVGLHVHFHSPSRLGVVWFKRPMGEASVMGSQRSTFSPA